MSEIYKPENKVEERLIKMQIKDPHLEEPGQRTFLKDDEEHIASINKDDQIVLDPVGKT